MVVVLLAGELDRDAGSADGRDGCGGSRGGDLEGNGEHDQHDGSAQGDRDREQDRPGVGAGRGLDDDDVARVDAGRDQVGRAVVGAQLVLRVAHGGCLPSSGSGVAVVGAGGEFGGGAVAVVGGEAAAGGGAGGGVLGAAAAVVVAADLNGANADHVVEAVRTRHRLSRSCGRSR